MGHDLGRLTAHASRHHGLFRVGDLDRFEVSPSQFRTLVRRGWCIPVARGVYRIAGAPETADQRLLTEIWVHPRIVVAAHRAAGRLFGLPGYGRARPEILREHRSSRRTEQRANCVVRSSLWLPSGHRTEVRSIPVTTIERTIFDLAGIEPPERVARAMDAALARRDCTTAGLQAVFFALARRGRRGTMTMRHLLEERGEGYVPPASELERRARRVIADAGLPTPSFEVDLGDDRWVGRVDCLWRAERVVLELDGARYHGGLTRRDDDRRRDNQLVAAGWRVIRVTWRDLIDDTDGVVRLLRRALGVASPTSDLGADHVE